jgi:two-component system OmpR family sensor kinase
MPVLLAGEAVLVLAAVTVAALVLHAVVAGGMHPLAGQASPLLAAATAGAAAVVALLCALDSRIRANPGMRLAGYAGGFYALVVMPVSVVDRVPGGDPVLPGAGAAVTAIFLVLLALSFARTPPRWLSGWRAIGGGLALTVLVIAAATVLPSPVAGVLDSSSTNGALLAGWGLLACAYITRGLRRRSPVWHRMGFGLAVIAAAHMLPLAGGTTIEFAVLRFVGFLVLLAALFLHTRALVRQRRTAEAADAEVAAAEERARSEFRHEVRNAVTTLSAVTTLMTPRPDAETENEGSIAAMIEEEFARLRGLVENTAGNGDTTTAAVDAVLSRLVTLRRAAGARITLKAPPGLLADLPAATLAQVVTNLLANCARHAAGAEIHVGAYREEGGCVVEVTDAGPGLGADMGTAPSAGDGLGLALSAQLVEAAGGALSLRPATRFPTGTTALLHLPLAAGTRRHLAAVPTPGKAAS